MIGAGGFAWVYRGWDSELDIPVAIKVLKPHFAGDADFETRFRQEASLAARLRHPNIIRILGVGRDGDAVFFAMDYVPNGLAQRLQLAPTLPDLAVAQVGRDVAAALAFAHREGVIHRDIKVDNILFDAHGNAIVADFGIARAVSGHMQQTGTNLVVGTPQYFSPEQARGMPVDGRSDIYSLGVTMFRAATGRLPFEGDDWYEIARKQIEDEPPPPRSFNPAITPALERIILTCLAKKPDDRYATADALRSDLTRVTGMSPSGEQTIAIPASAAGPMLLRGGKGWSASRRSRIFVASAASVAGILALAAIARGRAEGRPAEPAPRLVARDTGTPAAATGASSSRPPPAPPSTVLPPTMDAAHKPHPPRAKLMVSAPDDASITVRGAQGPARNGRVALRDSLAPGTYLVSATVQSVPGCPSAQDSARVTLLAGEAKDVTLTPTACGFLELTAGPPGAHYAVVQTGGNLRYAGVVPLKAPLMLPAGTYHIDVDMPQCAAYGGDSRILPSQTTHERALLVCPGRPPD